MQGLTMKKYILFLTIMCISSTAFTQDKPDSWKTNKSTHFIVYYRNAPEDFIDTLIDRAEDYYNRIADDLGFRRFNFWLWENRAKIYIHDNVADFQFATGQPGWSGGCALIRDKIIHSFPYAEGFFDTILPHEMGHIIFREFVGFDNNTIPLWLEERVASYQEKLRYSSAIRELGRRIKEGNFMNLETLSSANLHLTVDSNAVQLFYVEAFSIVDFLIKDFGKDKFVIFCQNLRDKNNFQSALASSYPFGDIKELDSAWQKHLKNE